MKSGWQDAVISACPAVKFHDPRTHGLTDPRDYTEWDLRHVGDSAIVLACLEADNPSLYGLCVEVGYANGLGVRVWLIEEPRFLSVDPRSRYFGMVRAVAERAFQSVGEAARAISDELGPVTLRGARGGGE